jgi:rare lipoprotein A (peptidoglycan hydrolase)
MSTNFKLAVAWAAWTAGAVFLIVLLMLLGRWEIIAVRANGAVWSECGLASVYGVAGDGQAGSRTATGERLDPGKLTAAHRTLPLGSYVAVRSMRHLGAHVSADRVVVRINDRGPFVHGRVIDLSTAAARELGFDDGLLPVCLDVL